MISDYRCFFCINRSFENLLNKYNIPSDDKINFTHEIATIFLQQQKQFSAPYIARDLHKAFRILVNDEDPFKDEKKWSNDFVMGIVDEWREKSLLAKNQLNFALRLAIAGNLIDYATSNSFDLNGTIQKVLNSSLAIDHSEQLAAKIANAKSILYLGDNAGEIVFDKLLIETINHPNLTYVVRGGPVINDITMNDADYVNMHTAANVITNGYDAPSTLLSFCSSEFIDAYKNADLVISKGQGNFEGLIQEKDKEIFFLLMAKCNVIADNLKVEKGDFIVKQNLAN